MTSPTKPNPVIFIHGLWIHSTAWQPWLELFESAGYTTSAPGWPGDAPTIAETRANPDALNDVGIQQMVDHYTDLIGTPEIKPVVVGHSFGGLIAQELLANGVVVARRRHRPRTHQRRQGTPLCAIEVSLPRTEQPGEPAPHSVADGQAVPLRLRHTLTEEESDALHAEWTIPGAGRPLFQDASANFFPHSPAKVDTHLAERGPLLLTSRTDDHVVPLKVTKEVFGMYSKGPADTDFHIFEGHGHSLTIDSRWKLVADVALEWLSSKGF
jgi:pimeloyl-ACP methyl ester carboxylesterase